MTSMPVGPLSSPKATLELVESLSPKEKEQIGKLFRPRIVDPYFRQIPHPVQQVALSLKAEELLYGGAAGGGKSSYMLMSALQYVDVPGYSALILRRTWPDLNAPEAILDRMKKWMAGLPVKMRDQGRQWEFPSGATIQFGYIQRDDAKYKFQGAEYQYIGYDELTQFEQSVYTWMFSRVRKPQVSCLSCSTALTRVRRKGVDPYFVHAEKNTGCPAPLPDPMVLDRYKPSPDGLTVFDIPLRVRGCSNPGGKGHQWVKEHFVSPPPGHQNPGVFIPASIVDNPTINRGEYEKMLEFLTPVDRERMLNGDWNVLDKGALFNRGDFQMLDQPPAESEIRHKVRCWDLAATTTKKSDWTVGALVSVDKRNRWIIEDIVRFQARPGEVEDRILATAEADGIHVKILMEQEPGSAGVNTIDNYRRNVLQGYQFTGERSTGNKEVRANAFAGQVQGQNVYLVKGAWNVNFLDEAQLFPDGAHDDQVDAVAAGFNRIAVRKKVRILV